MYNNKAILLSIAVCVVMAGCSSNDILPRGRLDYLKATSVNPLELPPDLVASQPGNINRTSTVLSQYNQQVRSGSNAADRVLRTSDSVRMERSGDYRWISTSLPADLVWTKSMQLFQELGLAIEVSNPEAGIAETAWAENRADVPESFIRRLLSKAMDQVFSAPTRDKFKLRLERDGSRVLVYVTHYGMKDKTSGRDDEIHTWVDRPRDVELEAELLSRLLVKLGGRDINESVRAGALSIEMEGTNGLTVNRPFQPVWVQVGNILDDGAEFRIESQDRASSTYTVAWKDPKKKTGSVLTFWKPRKAVHYRFNVSVSEQGKNQTVVRVQPLDGKSADLVMTRLRNNLH